MSQAEIEADVAAWYLLHEPEEGEESIVLPSGGAVVLRERRTYLVGQAGEEREVIPAERPAWDSPTRRWLYADGREFTGVAP